MPLHSADTHGQLHGTGWSRPRQQLEPCEAWRRWGLTPRHPSRGWLSPSLLGAAPVSSVSLIQITGGHSGQFACLGMWRSLGPAQTVMGGGTWPQPPSCFHPDLPSSAGPLRGRGPGVSWEGPNGCLFLLAWPPGSSSRGRECLWKACLGVGWWCAGPERQKILLRSTPPSWGLQEAAC